MFILLLALRRRALRLASCRSPVPRPTSAEFFDGQGPFFASPQVRGLPHGRFCEFGGIPSVEMPDVGGWEDDNRRGRRWTSEGLGAYAREDELVPPQWGPCKGVYRLAKDGASQTGWSSLFGFQVLPAPAGAPCKLRA